MLLVELQAVDRPSALFRDASRVQDRPSATSRVFGRKQTCVVHVIPSTTVARLPRGQVGGVRNEACSTIDRNAVIVGKVLSGGNAHRSGGNGDE